VRKVTATAKNLSGKPTMRIVKLVQTCSACPAQWEGELEDSRAIYIRYRWGSLGFGVGVTLSDAIDDCEYVKEIGEQFDGFIPEDELSVRAFRCCACFSACSSVIG
jgi:hypothetical protein